MRPTSPAELPPTGLPGLDPSWSRLVTAKDADGVARTWHVLEAVPLDAAPVGTLLCVHGNPTWSYLWRSVVAAGVAAGWRVVAPDHLGMGWSERTGRFHRLADRITELGALTEALDVEGPVVTVAHDWGGVVSLGWTLEHSALVAGVVLTNTAVSQPDDARVPGLIGLARTPGLLRQATVTAPVFLRGTLRLAHPRLPRAVENAYLAPYRTAARRQAIGDFVADIPLEATHPSRAVLDRVAAGLPALAGVPSLLLWGPRDPVFADRYLRDLQRRLPGPATHRFEGAGHLVVEDAPVADAAVRFADDVVRSARPADTGQGGRAEDATVRRPLWAAIDERADDAGPALVEMAAGGARRSVSWQQLHRVVTELAAGLSSIGVRKGDRVGLLVPPGADLTAAVYACWRLGAVIVVADAGLGLPGMRRALRGADLRFVVGTPKGLAVARAMGLGATLLLAGGPRAAARAVGASSTLAEVAAAGRGSVPPEGPAASDEAAVLFTSGATGPAKGVVYRHAQLEAQRDLLVRAFGVRRADRFVAAFAPFALYGPALGVASAVPDCDVTSPGTLTASALADAVDVLSATLVFGAPAALRNVVATADDASADQRSALRRVRLLLSAGAPVPVGLLQAASHLLGDCEAHTPYGMTEVLPVTDIELTDLVAAGEGDGVCVGRPLPGVQVAVSPLDDEGRAVGGLTQQVGTAGEICVQAPHVKDHYDQLWATERASSRNAGWHRTGDVGHLDAEGRLWVEGRLAHVVVTADGPVTPVGLEHRVQHLGQVRSAAVVGVGPRGTQQVVVVVEAPGQDTGLASLGLADAVREAAGVPVAAVLVVPDLPVDVRHNSKVDRAALADLADRLLAGGGHR